VKEDIYIAERLLYSGDVHVVLNANLYKGHLSEELLTLYIHSRSM